MTQEDDGRIYREGGTYAMSVMVRRTPSGNICLKQGYDIINVTLSPEQARAVVNRILRLLAQGEGDPL